MKLWTDRKFSSIFIVVVLALVPYIASAASIAMSEFCSGTESWKLSGDTTSADPNYVASNGNPGGFIRGYDVTTGGVWYWDAPAKFLGDVSRALGYDLTYELRMRGSGPIFYDSDVVLNGAGISLHFDTSAVPVDTLWTSYSIPLTAGAGWRVSSLSGAAATQAQMTAVLSDLDRLRIRGEFITGSDNGDLDNVVLNGAPVPVPAALILFGSGLAGLAGFRVRQRNR